VWAACDGIASPDEIAHLIEEAYAGSRQAIARDVPAVINRFRRLGLLRPTTGEGDDAH
jgi:Coenzyme PQQ synthesis protein D (PqqD)